MTTMQTDTAASDHFAEQREDLCYYRMHLRHEPTSPEATAALAIVEAALSAGPGTDEWGAACALYARKRVLVHIRFCQARNSAGWTFTAECNGEHITASTSFSEPRRADEWPAEFLAEMERRGWTAPDVYQTAWQH